MNISFNSREISFERNLHKNEIRTYTKTINEGLKLLDKKMDIIIHNSAAPANSKQNTGIGSLLSENYEKKLLPFLKKHGFSSVQQDPDGLRKFGDGSPYVGDAFAKNILMIPLEKLTKRDYGKILAKKTFNNIVQSRPNKNSNIVDFNFTTKMYKNALNEAYETFIDKKQNETILKFKKIINNLDKKFNNFKTQNSQDLEKTALYQVLSDIHGNNYWKNWGNELDKNLFFGEKTPEKLDRIKFLKQNYAKNIDEFMFEQMLISDTRQATNIKNKKFNIKTIGDSAIAFSDSDVWANRNLFKEGWNLGCPADVFSKDGQAWGFAIIEPDTIFNQKSQLNDGGKLLYKKYVKMFKDNPGGVRIDHIIGLIDPFVYMDKPSSINSGRLYSHPFNKDLGKYTKHSVDEYANILEKIVIPAANEAGLKSNSIICEDLGSITQPVKNVIEKLNLRGIAVTQYSNGALDDTFRGKNIPQNKIAMIGSHDNIPLIEYVKNLFTNPQDLYPKAKALAEDTSAPNTNIEEFTQKLMSNQSDFRTAKFVELFTSNAKKIQIFFTDFFGDNRTYNKPGTSGKENWSIRICNNFEKFYHDKLIENKGLNLPEVLSAAIKHKNLTDKNNRLLEKLDYFSKILKEKN